jgi:tRNA threonylcarbamoyladenosine biosynthesis protein TsaE
VEAPRLAEHDPAWADAFAVEAVRITEALGGEVVAVEHVGSTAVKGLPAKPTIDVAVGVTSLELPRTTVDRILALGYEDAANDSRPGERRFRKGSEFPREIIVHIVEWGGPIWRDYVAFRDALRSDPTLVREYAELKQTLLATKGDWYSGEGKREFIGRVLSAAPARVFSIAAVPNETEAIAARLAVRLRSGDVVHVSGDLGAGKTTFVRGACRALGVVGPVTSPTYTIGHRHDGVSHLDLFRFEQVTDADWGALEPYFEDAIVFVEWPERAGTRLPPPRVTVRLGHVDEPRRSIALSSDEADLLAGLI